MILCTHNGAETIGEQVDALIAQQASVPWELVLVDNRCTDDTVAIVRSRTRDVIPVRVVPAMERPGLGYARNAGVAAAGSRYLAFCDDDDVVGAGWIDAISDAVKTDRYVGSRMEYDRLNGPEIMRGRSQYQARELAQMFGFSIANGAGFAIERELWERVGGTDESLTDTGEDIDFAIRVQLECGVRPVLAERAVYHYRQRAGGWRSFRQGSAYGRAHVMLYVRYGQGRADLGAERARARKDWAWIATRAPAAVVRTHQSAWARRFGLRLGRLQGSLEHRVWYP